LDATESPLDHSASAWLPNFGSASSSAEWTTVTVCDVVAELVIIVLVR